MSIIDRILNGEFDEDNDSIRADDCLVPGEMDEDQVDEGPDIDEDDGDYDDDEHDDLPEEDDEDIEDSYTIDDDVPSDEYCEEYMKENNISDEPVLVAPKNSMERKKETKMDSKNNKSTASVPNNSASSSETPKQTTAPASTSSTETKRGRGRPHKLAANASEVVSLYNEGVGAKTIAEKYGVSVSCVINCLKSQKVEIRPKGRRKSS